MLGRAMRFDGLDLNLLVTLDVLLETRSVTDAAFRLNLSQPSVSAALSRLRHYFDDELLMQMGRKMVPTAKGLELEGPIREMLNFVRFRITSADEFDPLTSKRNFRIVVSDYAYDVVIARALARAGRLAPHVSFDLSSPGPQHFRQFRDGDIDIMVTVSDYMIEDHPHHVLFHDEDAVITWGGGRYAGSISSEQFLAAQHVIAVFGQERMPTITESYFAGHGVERKVAMQVPSFAALPRAILDTDRVATLHRRHADLFARIYPICIHPLPLKGPEIRELMQWHRLKGNDQGLRWLMQLIKDEADLLSA